MLGYDAGVRINLENITASLHFCRWRLYSIICAISPFNTMQFQVLNPDNLSTGFQFLFDISFFQIFPFRSIPVPPCVKVPWLFKCFSKLLFQDASTAAIGLSSEIIIRRTSPISIARSVMPKTEGQIITALHRKFRDVLPPHSLNTNYSTTRQNKRPKTIAFGASSPRNLPFPVRGNLP